MVREAGTANDGLQNGTEPGVVGVTVNLYKDLNNDGDVLDAGETTPFATMITGANGIYNFTGLTPGNYQVGIVVPSGYDNSAQTNATNDGANDATGSDFVPATDRSYIVVLGAGETENDIDAGLVGTAALGDRVWLDNGDGGGTANDGLQNGTEPGVVGVTVNLYKDLNNDGDVLDAGETTPFATMMTGANGIYNFTGLT
ncbi:MAG: hypothetical protein IPL23_11065, partial [Saprospiraceae bacterium]|nr:hypothetical protein [Saprospiraceae bacterium]